MKYDGGTSWWSGVDEDLNTLLFPREVVKMKRSRIKYSTCTIRNRFRNNDRLKAVARGIKAKRRSVEDFLPMPVFYHANCWWTGGNRRLHCFELAGVQEVPVTIIEKERIDITADGLTVSVLSDLDFLRFRSFLFCWKVSLGVVCIFYFEIHYFLIFFVIQICSWSALIFLYDYIVEVCITLCLVQFVLADIIIMIHVWLKRFIIVSVFYLSLLIKHGAGKRGINFYR